MTDYSKVEGFHTHSNLFFKRMPDGSVRVQKWTNEKPFSLQSEVLLDPNTWASVVASMSKEGESSKTFHEALDKQI